MDWANIPPDEPIQHGIISRSIAQAQVRVEGHNFDIRKRVLEYDDVVNKQREVIYKQRQEVLSGNGLREQYLKIIEEAVVDTLDELIPEDEDPDTWDLDTLYRQLFTVFPVPPSITPETMAGKDVEQLEEMLIAAVHEAYERKTAELGPEIMPRAERLVMLSAIDQYWRRHLTDLDVLREGIGLMAIAQRDPLVEYKRTAFEMWQGLQGEIRRQAGRDIFRVQVNVAQPQPRRVQAFRPQMTASAGGATVSKPEPVRKTAKDRLGRNDPCWCGSGKKYKNCHLRQDRQQAS
jgi:preprotein translocase subunit SecA